MPHIHLDDVSIAYRTGTVVESLDLDLPDGRITAIVGANGSGKSTVLKTIARILEPSHGAVYLDGKNVHRTPTKEIAKELSILPQDPLAPEGLTVRDLIGYGRSPYRRGLHRASAEDLRMTDWAIEVTALTALADRPVAELSGGQRQRAWIAMAVAQGTQILLLDEPTAFLDVGHQLEVLELVTRLGREQQRTVVMVLHDLNHAARFADHLVVIRDGQVVASGAPAEVITPELLQDVFRVRADVVTAPHTGTPIFIPYGLVAPEGDRR